MEIEHQVTLVAKINLDELDEGKRSVLESWTDEERNRFIHKMSVDIINEVLKKVNEGSTWAFLTAK